MDRKGLNILELYKEKEPKKSQAEEYKFIEEKYYRKKSSKEEQQPQRVTIDQIISSIGESYIERKRKTLYKDKSEIKMIKTEVENLRKKIIQLIQSDANISQTLGRIDRKLDNLDKTSNIAIAFKNYEEKKNAIKELLKKRYPFEKIAFKCIYVTKETLDFLELRDYKFDKIDKDKYFSKENEKNIVREFKKYFKNRYGSSKKEN